MVRLTRIIGGGVVTPDGQRVGRLRDLSVDFGEDHPLVQDIVVTMAHGAPAVIPWSLVDASGDDQIVIRASEDSWTRLPDWDDGACRLLLHRDVLDTQIVDVGGRRVARVGEVLLGRRSGELEVVAAELGARPVLRRLVPLGVFEPAGTTVDWADLHLTSDRGHEVQLTSKAAAMNRLDAGGLAHLLAELDVEDVVDVVDAVGVIRTAAALARAEQGVATRVLEALGRSTSGDVLDAMPTPTRESLRAALRRSARGYRRLWRFDGWRRHRRRTLTTSDGERR